MAYFRMNVVGLLLAVYHVILFCGKRQLLGLINSWICFGVLSTSLIHIDLSIEPYQFSYLNFNFTNKSLHSFKACPKKAARKKYN
jgi:hypothetical protein